MTPLEKALAEWLPTRRWFGSKGRDIDEVRIVDEHRLVDGDPSGVHVVVEVFYTDGAGDERYQLLLGHRRALPERLDHAIITASGDGFWYDGVYDHEIAHVLLQLVATDDESDIGLRFHHLPGVEIDTDLTSTVMSAEQSNTSLVYGDAYILKLFRKVAYGLNPDLEVTRALAEAGCASIVPPLGWLEADLAHRVELSEPPPRETSTLGMLQPFLKSANEGWFLAVTSVRDLFAEADLRADEVGGDFAGESERLGRATAEVHQLLARVLPSRLADETDNRETAKLMYERLDAALAVVPDLAPHADALRAAYDLLADLPSSVPIQRIHGDYHLGQALRTDSGWVLIDFEGEPARPLHERTTLMSPLRDVAGMLRSFDYAARHLLMESGGNQQLTYRALEWTVRNQSAFCDGYAAASGRDPRDDGVLLRAFEMDKAIYEVVYEARNRPSWLPIPLGALERLTEVSP